MGKGDKKTRRGKITNRSYGVRRPKSKENTTPLEVIVKVKKPKAVAKTAAKSKK